MGRDAQFFCRTCKKQHYLGYGSYGTWLDDCKTLEQFDARVARNPELGTLFKNQNVRKCLVEHAGHEYETHSNDWLSGDRGGVLYAQLGIMGSDVPLIEDYDEWTHENMAPD